MRTTRIMLLAGIALFLAVEPRAAQGQAISVEDDGVAVDASFVAAQATIGDDDTVILKPDGGAAPVAEPQKEAVAEPEKKAETPTDEAPSLFDSVFDSLGSDDETPPPAAVDKK